MKKLRILKVLYARPHVGGSGRVGLELGLELARRGHEVHILSYPGTYLSKKESQLLQLHTVPDISYGSFKTFPTGLTFPSTIYNLQKKFGFDILHAHYAITHGEAVIDGKNIIKHKMATKRDKEPVAVITCHGSDISINGLKDAIKPALEFRLSLCDGLSFVSSHLKKKAMEIFDLKHYGDVIPNFVDETKFQKKDDVGQKNKLRTKLGIPRDSLVFYHVSNFRPVKNTSVIIKAMNLAVNYYGLDDVHLMLIGDGPEKTRALSLVNEYKLGDKVHFVGTVSPEKVPEYSRIGDVLILPSKKEAFGLVNLEAMHLGKPVLASNVGGIPEVIVHGKNGYMFQPDDIETIAAQMKNLREYPDLVKKMGIEGHKMAQTFFSRKKIGTMYENFYNEAIRKRDRKNESS